MKAVIMAGGRGTRIQSVASDIPKPMIPVLGKPVLEYQIENLKRCGITDILLITGYLSDAVMDYFGDGSKLGVNIRYFNEDKPMGTAGALYYVKEQLKEDFILLMGDLMISVDFERFMAEHKKSGAAVTLFVHPNSHPFDSDIIVTDEVGKLADFTEDKCGENAERGKAPAGLSKPVTGVISKKLERAADFYYHNQVNSGIYALSPEAAALVPEPVEKIDLDKDIIRPLIEAGRVYAYRSTEYVKDMGTPDRYDEVTEAVRSGLVEQRNLSNKQKCIFLDRDGTINIERGFLNNVEGMALLPGAADALRRINSSEYLAVLITNQPVIARGDCSFETLDNIMKKFDTLLGREGVYVDRVYYCPHHTDRGFPGEVPELKFRCRCRKGRSGMIEDAARDLNIDLEGSWMIGDKTSDVQCGMGAGTKTVLLQTGAGGNDGRFDKAPTLVCSDLAEAAERILDKAL
ncbi:MAG: HAD-IIIA family hydrolase [Eubacteriales bacterium]|nr:HAD-IIIA family hydrolase [Eubacteriales bacterium]